MSSEDSGAVELSDISNNSYVDFVFTRKDKTCHLNLCLKSLIKSSKVKDI